MSVEDIQEFGDIILLASERMSRLAENYIFLSQLETIAHNPDTQHELLLQTTPHSKDVITEAIQPYFSTKAQRLNDFDMQLDDACIAISEKYLKKVVHELVDNACKFSNQGSSIRLGSRIVNDCFELIVHDNERGMKAQQIKQIDAYVQFEREKVRTARYGTSV